MRVAFVSVSDQLGGSEAMLLQTASEFRTFKPDWDLHLVVPGTGPLGPKAAALGIHVSVLPMPGSLARMGESGLSGGHAAAGGVMLAKAALSLPPYERRLRDLLSAIRPDVVHTNGFKAHVLSSRARVESRAILWHMHEYISQRPLTRRLIRHYADRCSLIVANSESVAADVRTATGTRTPVRVIYNAVDLRRFSPRGPVADLDALSGLPPARRREPFVSASSPPSAGGKGTTRSCGRWRRCRPRCASAPYIVGGALYDTKGSQYSALELQRLAATCGLSDRVGFTGFIERADEAMRALDVVVHASTEPEPFGLVIAEGDGLRTRASSPARPAARRSWCARAKTRSRTDRETLVSSRGDRAAGERWRIACAAWPRSAADSCGESLRRAAPSRATSHWPTRTRPARW